MYMLSGHVAEEHQPSQVGCDIELHIILHGQAQDRLTRKVYLQPHDLVASRSLHAHHAPQTSATAGLPHSMQPTEARKRSGMITGCKLE